MRIAFLAMILALTLSACGWFGGKDDKAAAANQLPSDEILRKNCTDEQWKQQNMGLWYSVCRQPMKW